MPTSPLLAAILALASDALVQYYLLDYKQGLFMLMKAEAGVNNGQWSYDLCVALRHFDYGHSSSVSDGHSRIHRGKVADSGFVSSASFLNVKFQTVVLFVIPRALFNCIAQVSLL